MKASTKETIDAVVVGMGLALILSAFIGLLIRALA